MAVFYSYVPLPVVSQKAVMHVAQYSFAFVVVVALAVVCVSM